MVFCRGLPVISLVRSFCLPPIHVATIPSDLPDKAYGEFRGKASLPQTNEPDWNAPKKYNIDKQKLFSKQLTVWKRHTLLAAILLFQSRITVPYTNTPLCLFIVVYFFECTRIMLDITKKEAKHDA